VGPNHVVPNPEGVPLTPLDGLQLEGNGRASCKVHAVEDGGDLVAAVDAGDEQEAHLTCCGPGDERHFAAEVQWIGYDVIPLSVAPFLYAHPSALFLLPLSSSRSHPAYLFC